MEKIADSGLRKFGLAGVIVSAALLASPAQWPVALIALGIYSIANVCEAFAHRSSGVVDQHSADIIGLANLAHTHFGQQPVSPPIVNPGAPTPEGTVPEGPQAHVGQYL